MAGRNICIHSTEIYRFSFLVYFEKTKRCEYVNSQNPGA